MKRAFLLFGIGLLAACTSGESREDRCTRVEQQMNDCAGAPLAQLDCSAVSSADLDRFDDLSQGLACQALQGVAPTDGDPMSAACRMLGIGCISAVTAAPALTPARYPVVLVNGIDTSPLFRYSTRIVTTMETLGGHHVYLATLAPYQPPRVRAPQLWQRIQDVLADAKTDHVNLICHSLGGLDCRYLVSPGGLAADLGVAPDTMAKTVASITTVATAHHGTRVADVLLGDLPDGDAGDLANDLATIAGDTFSPERLTSDAALRDSLKALSVDESPVFNAEITDAPGILYQSWAGFSRPFGTATAEHDALLEQECALDDGTSGLPVVWKHDFMALALIPFSKTVEKDTTDGPVLPNDGFITVTSAKYGHFRGCIPADHMEQLGQKDIPDVNVRSGFDVAWFYTDIAGDLAAQGF